jgi:short-subunit dehydrogenase
LSISFGGFREARSRSPITDFDMNRSVLITGGSSGIGKSLAFEMCRRGFRIALVSRRREALEIVRRDLCRMDPSATVEVEPLDVTDTDAVATVIRNLAERVGGIGIVVANAGIGLGEKVGRGRFHDSRRTVEVNLIGAMATVDAAVEYFMEKGEGHVVGISSVAALRGTPRGASYAASKAGLASYLETLRAEIQGQNILVSVLYPGFIDTPLNERVPRRPFLISSDRGAALIADAIEKRVRRAFIPRFPWSLVGPLLRILPTTVISRL